MARIPWTEKYRPITLDDIVGNKNIIATLKGFIITQVVPQLIILWGLPGIGKTSAAFAFARDYYIRKGIYDKEGKLQAGVFPPLLVMRGAVGIETIRTTVHSFMRHAPPPSARRIIIFDEAEMISREALLELRPYIEQYAKTCSVIFTTNVNPHTWLDYFDPLLAALRDRALIYHFEPPTAEEISTHLRMIVREEKFEISDEALTRIAAEAEGSVRKAIELLQAEYARIMAMKPPMKPPLVEWATAWADYNVVSRNFDVFPPEMRIEVKKFVREWERKYGKGYKAMGAPLQPCTVEDAKRMEKYCEYVKATPEIPERYPTAQSVVNYAVDDALTHIAGDYILKNVRRIFQSEGREAARKFLKENIRHYGSYGPGRPGLTGTPRGIRVSYKGKDYTVTWNEILNRALEPAYSPTYKEVPPEVPPPVPEVPEVELPRIHATRVDVGIYKAGEYYIMLMNPEKYGDRPILSAMRRRIKDVEEYVALGKELYDTEALGLIPEPGEEWWEELPEELKHDAVIYWTAEDVEWDPNVEADRVIYHKTYFRIGLEALKVDELRRISSVKGLSPIGRKAELINRILGKPPPKPPEKPPKPPPVVIPPPVEKGLTKEDEEEMRTEFQAILLRRTVSPRKWLPIFRDEMAKWNLELADWPRDRARKEAKADLLRRVIPDIIELAKPPKPPPRALPVRPPREPPVPVRVEVPVEREPDIVTRRCWLCDEPFEADRELEKRVRETITTIRGPRDVVYREPLLGFRMLFYYLCEEHRNERFGFRDIYDALAYQLVEARSSGYKKLALTKEVLKDRGLTPEDIAEIQVRVTRWLPPGSPE